MEYKDQYALSTLLDAKYKRYFFRDPAAFDHARNRLIEKLVQAMRSESDIEVKPAYTCELSIFKWTWSELLYSGRAHYLLKYHNS